MKKILLWASLPMVLNACQMEPKAAFESSAIYAQSHSAQVETFSLDSNADIAGKVALPVMHQRQQYWLLTSEQQGLLLTDQNGKKLAQYPGNFELLDRRSDVQIADKTWDVLATVDNESGDALLIGLDWPARQFSVLQRISHASSIEALCLQTLPQGQTPQRNIALVMADDDGMLTQRIVIDGTQHRVSNVLLRQFVGVPQVKDCVVDDDSQSLYVTEANIGVWRYSAVPEAELTRELVVVTAQQGILSSASNIRLEGEVTSVEMLADGSLLVATPEQRSLWHIDSTQTNRPQRIEIKGAQEIESAHVISTKQGVLVGLFDDKTGLYQQAVLPLAVTRQSPVASHIKTVLPIAETQAVETSGDAADDPAIWLNRLQPHKARILGTNKKRGLNVYDLKGTLLQSLPVGRVNNVDVRYDFTVLSKTFDIAAASNRSTRSISLFSIDPHTGKVSYMQDIATGLNDVYGLCMGQMNGQYHVFVNDTDGHFEQYQLETEGSRISGKLVRQFKIASQPEGCVVDDDNAQLYFGEEAKGIWQISAAPNKSQPILIASLNQHFVADVEGIGIYHVDKKRYLIASSQGNNSFAVFALDDNNRYLGSFDIGMNLAANVDGVSETDGLEIIASGLGDIFPEGLMVVQDGRNIMPSHNQNFKLVDATPLAELIRSWRNDIH